MISNDYDSSISMSEYFWSELSITSMLQKKVFFLWMQHLSFDRSSALWAVKRDILFSQTPRYVREDQWAPPPCLHAWQAHTKCLRRDSLIQHHILTVAPHMHFGNSNMRLVIYHCPRWQYKKHLQTLDTWQMSPNNLFKEVLACVVSSFYVSALQPQASMYIDMGRREWLMGQATIHHTPLLERVMPSI